MNLRHADWCTLFICLNLGCCLKNFQFSCCISSFQQSLLLPSRISLLGHHLQTIFCTWCKMWGGIRGSPSLVSVLGKALYFCLLGVGLDLMFLPSLSWTVKFGCIFIKYGEVASVRADRLLLFLLSSVEAKWGFALSCVQGRKFLSLP